MSDFPFFSCRGESGRDSSRLFNKFTLNALGRGGDDAGFRGSAFGENDIGLKEISRRAMRQLVDYQLLTRVRLGVLVASLHKRY